MTLRAKTLLTVSAALAGLLLVLYLILRPVVLHEFARAEREVATRRLQRVREAWNRENADFAANFGKWANSDAMADYALNGNAQFEAAELNPGALSAAKADLIAVVRGDGTVLFSRLVDDKSGNFQQTLPPEMARQLQGDGPLLSHQDGFDSRVGLWITPQGPMLVASLPITASDRNTPVRGTLLMGRALPRLDWMRYLEASEQTPEFQAFSADLSAPFAAAWQAMNEGGRSFLRDEPARARSRDDSRVMAGYFLVNGLSGQPIGLMRVASELEIMPRAEMALFYFTLLMLGCGALFLVLALVPVERLVLSRVARVNHLVNAVRTSGDLSQRVDERGDDELSQLGANINRTLAALQAVATRQKRSERLYRQMAETALNAGDAYFVWQAGQQFLDWHGDIDALLGYPPGGMKRTQKAWLQHIHSVDQGKVVRACARGLALGQSVRVEFRVIRCDGTTRFWMIRAKPLAPDPSETTHVASMNVKAPLDGDSAPRLLAVCIDVTARKQAEEALRQSEDRLQRIFDTAADAIIIADRDGQISFANEAAARIFGLFREEITARTIHDKAWKYSALDGGDFDPSENPFSRVRATGEPIYEAEFGLANSEGDRLIVSVNAAPLLDARGNFSGMVASFADVTERRTLQERLKYQAFHDSLTGLANRALLRDRLEHSLTRRDQGDTPIAVLFIDLDNFKYINDSLGHAVGDELIVEIASRLKISLRAGDTAARFGGDEFVVLLEVVDSPHYAIQVAERLLEEMTRPFFLSGREVFTTPSIGIAFSTGAFDQPDELLRHADAAMYEAKRRGKARYEVFQSSMSASALNRLETENDLRRALQKGEFFLHFQPKWNLATNSLYGFEALVRWTHPQRGLVSPGDFIPIAEETGLIVPLGFMVLKSACEQAKIWSVGLEKPLFMAVNVSARQLQTPEIVSLVAQVIEESGFSPSHLILEITESSIVERTGDMLDTLNALKALGVKLAIDDFGTGYSSLAYLRAFPFDYLKIDRQFVTNVHEEGGNGVIISSMITLAHALDLSVIAEGAEQPEEVAHLRKLGCDLAQGYYFGRPMPPSEIEMRLGLKPSHIAALQLSL